MATPREREFTGRHMLAIILAFFGVIIAVNVTMATVARKSWSGLVVANTYVASQQFNAQAEQARRQAALGWTATLTVDAGIVRYAVADANGRAVDLAGATATFRRPVGTNDDRTLTLAPTGAGAMEAAADLADGVWIVDVTADAGLAEPFREARRVFMRGGRLQ